MADELLLQIEADTKGIEASYKEIEKLEEDRAQKARVLTEQTLALRKKALRQQEQALQKLIKQQEEAGASLKEQFNKPIEEGAERVKQLEGEISKLEPATKKATFAQEQLGKAVKRVQSTLRGFAITAAIAFGAAALKAVIDYAKRVLEAAENTDRLAEAQKKAAVESAKERATLERLVAIAKDHTQSLANREAAIKRLNELSPTYLGDLTLEKINTDEATIAINNYVAAIERKITARILESDLEEAIREQEKAEQALTEAKNKQAQATDKANKAEKEGADLRGGGIAGLSDLDKAQIGAESSATLLEKAQTRYNKALADKQAILDAIANNERLGLSADALTDAERAAEEERKKNEEEAKRRLEDAKKNFAQAVGSLRGLQIELERAAIEQITNEETRLVLLAELDAEAAKEQATTSIANAEQRAEAIKLIEEKLALQIQTIRATVAGKEAKETSDLIEDLGKQIRGLTDDVGDFTVKGDERLAAFSQRRKADALAIGAGFKDIFEAVEKGSKETVVGYEEIEKAVKGVNDELALQQQRTESSINALSLLGGAFTDLSKAVGEGTEKGAELAKVAALFNIAASQATAIASVVSMAARVGEQTASPFAFLATLAAGLAVTIANIANAKSVLEGAELPRFAEGVAGFEGGLAVVGERGREVVYLPKGASVLNNDAVRSEREMIEALNDGTINEYLTKHYIYPAMLAMQQAQEARSEKQMEKMFHNYFDQKFDDRNLLGVGKRQIDLLKVVAKNTKPTPKPSFRTR